VLDGMAHAKDKLHQLADRLDDHFDSVIRRVDDVDSSPDVPALTGATTTRVDRTSTELLYRSDSRPPDVVFAEGFQVRDATNNDLDHFVRTNAPSNFVSTTRDDSLYQRWDRRIAIPSMLRGASTSTRACRMAPSDPARQRRNRR